MKTLWIGLPVILLLSVLLLLFQSPATRPARHEIGFSELLRNTKGLKAVVIRGHMLNGIDGDGVRFATVLPPDPTLATRLADAGVPVTIAEEPERDWRTTLLVNGLPMLIYLAAWLWPLLRIARALERRR